MSKNGLSCQLENNDMKTKSFILAAFLATTVFYAPYSIGQSNVVYYGANTNAISISFGDTNLSSSAQTHIVSDLQLCLQEWGKGTQFRLGADDPAFVAHLYNPDITPYYQDGTEFPNDVVNGPTGYALHIPKTLSDTYTNALVFAAANSNIVASAYEFVAFISSSNFVSISSNAMPNYILYKNPAITSNVIVELAPQLIADLRCQTYFPPSILGFYYSSKGPSATNLWMQVPCSIPTGWGSLGWHGCPVLWHDGKWKFCTWEDWVP